MSILDSFYQQFIARHDFNDSDIDVFLSRWKNKATFKNIPLAWIIPLDKMMFKLNISGYTINSVCQEYGQLIVIVPADNNAPAAFKIIDSTKAIIKNIDKDLYSLFDINIAEEYSNKRYKEAVNAMNLNCLKDSN